MADPMNIADGTAPAPAPGARQPIWFLVLYALANAGGVIGFLPLLTLLLPLKVETIAGGGRLGLFTVTVVAGALAASGANLLFGWLSDRSVAHGGGRRRWMLIGLAMTAASYAGVAAAHQPFPIVSAVVGFQVALNAVLAPLAAIMGDEIPDVQKGLTAGLSAFAVPAGALTGAVVIGISGREEVRLAVVVAVCATLVLPLALIRPRCPTPATSAATGAGVIGAKSRSRRDLAVVWCGRLLVQTANVGLQLYLLYYFEGIARDVPTATLPGRLSHLLTAASLLPLPVALLVGRLSDRSGRRKPFLLAAALLTSVGMVAMAGARGWFAGALAFGVYALGAGVLVPLQSALSVQLLPDPRRRGRDLGVLNLTNTLPSLLGPLLTWLLAAPGDFTVLMLALAALAAAGGLTMLAVRGSR